MTHSPKKLIALFLVLVMLFPIAACGSDTETSTSATDDVTESTNHSSPPTESTTSSAATDGSSTPTGGLDTTTYRVIVRNTKGEIQTNVTLYLYEDEDRKNLLAVATPEQTGEAVFQLPFATQYYVAVEKADGTIESQTYVISQLSTQIVLPATPETPAVYENITANIIFYHTMGTALSDVLDAHIEEFNKLYPNIKVYHEWIGGYDDVHNQIKDELTVGCSPNIAYCYPDHVAVYNTAKAVVTLDAFIDSKVQVIRADGSIEIVGLTNEQKADFISGFYQGGAVYGDGKMYTMPLSKSTEVLYYNKTFFDAHGLAVPTTWDEMEEVCRQIKEIDPDSIPLAYDSESNWFITMCEQLGTDYTSATGEHYLFDNAENKAFVSRFRDWYQKGYVTTQFIWGGYTSALFTATNGQRCYMSIGSTAGASHYRSNFVDIAGIPQADPSNPKMISQGPSLCIFQGDNDQEVLASWLFVKYLTTSVDFQSAFSMVSGYVPVLKSVLQHPVYATYLSQTDSLSALATKTALEQYHACYTSPAFVGSADFYEVIGQLMIDALTENTNIDQLFYEAVMELKYGI